MNATAHYWLLRDVFGGTHPTGVSEERYVRALADLVATLAGGHQPSAPAPGTEPDPEPGPGNHHAQNPSRQGQLP
jgi:hypothetical protein